MNEAVPGTSSNAPPSSGILRTKISLKSGTVVTPFHTFKTSLPPYSEIQGNHDLLTSYGLGPVENGFTGPRRVKESMSTFLPHIIGEFNFDVTKDASSLKALIEKPPIHKEISNLTSSAMQGFKLSAGLVDERYRHFFEKRKEDGILVFNEKSNTIRVRAPYDQYGFEDDDTEKQFPKKQKKKKKDKKRKKDKDSSDGSEKKKKKKHHDDLNTTAPMEF